MKRIYRSRQNRVFGGVCSGIGEYLNVDPVLIRVGFGLMAFMGGAGLLAYLLLWIAIPDESFRTKYYEKAEENDYVETEAEQVNETETGEQNFADMSSAIGKEAKKKAEQIQNYIGFKWIATAFGLFLIFMGISFLGNTLGWFSFNLWHSFWSFWPFILLFIGVSVMPMKSWIKSTLNIILLLILFTLVFSENTNICKDSRCATHSSAYLRNAPDVKVCEMEVKQIDSLGYLNIEAGACTILGVGICSDLAEIEESTGVVVRKFEISNTEYQFKIRSNNMPQTDIITNLNPRLIWDIDIDAGAGAINFDLSKHRIKKVDIASGASSIELKFGDLYSKTDVEIETGVSSVRVNIPKEIGVCLTKNSVLGSSRIEGLSRRENKGYYSDNFESAASKIYINIEGALSSFELVR